MHADADHELLRRYADHGSDEAFTELVHRHLNLVWAAARRVTGNTELARDVAQLVFTDLARKARTLPLETVIAGWLHRAACLAAAKQIRGEVRRSQREQLAMSTFTSDPAGPDESQAAAELQPVLDEALAELPATDRDAVVLRFLAGRSYAEVGASLGTGEDAAQKRVSRALEKLRESFRRRGLDVSSGLVVAALGYAGAQAAPLGLAGTVAAGALAAAGTAGGMATLVLLMKSKLTLGLVGGAALVAALAWQQRNLNRLTDENSALRSQMTAAAPAPSAAVSDKTDAETLARLREQQDELLRLRGEVAHLRRTTPPANSASSTVSAPASKEIDALATQMLIAQVTRDKVIAAMKHLGLAARVFATDNAGRYPTTFEEMKNEMGLTPDGNLPGAVPAELFEFFPQERDISDGHPQIILFHEKAARHLPDGTWERVYCMADGSVQRINRADGDFSEIEQISVMVAKALKTK